jgi:hypothetical protein
VGLAGFQIAVSPQMVFSLLAEKEGHGVEIMFHFLWGIFIGIPTNF